MPPELKQFVPNKFCLKCDVCCRYSEKNSAYAAFFLPDEISNPAYFKRIDKSHGCQISLVPYEDIYKCPHFLSSNNKCKIYSKRPLDCRLYPFLIAYDKEYKSVNLYLDKQCPYKLPPHLNLSPSGKEKLNSPSLAQKIAKNHAFVMPHQENTIFLSRLEKITDEIFKPSCGLTMLGIEHKDIFERYLKPCSHLGFSTRSFVNIYIWSDLFKILWKIIDDNLCVFYWYGNDFAMMFPPIFPAKSFCKKNRPEPMAISSGGEGLFSLPGKKAVLESIEILRTLNKANCRIENIAGHEIKILEECGLKIHENTDEYIYLRKDLERLTGNKFASQRAAVNQFTKRYATQAVNYRPFKIEDTDECLDLYGCWAAKKMGTGLKPVPIFQDNVSHQLIVDSFSAHKKAMMDYEKLGLVGRVVKIDGKIAAYAFGFKLNDNTYCVMLETANLSIKGLPQFVFSRFAQELAKDAEYINAMDDSGLENLRRVKLSWRPCKILSNYIGVVGAKTSAPE